MNKEEQLENKEETLIRDVLIKNLIDPEIQKEPHKRTVDPRQAMELATNMEDGMRDQHQAQQHNRTLIPASSNTIQYPTSTLSSNSSLSNNFHCQVNRPPLYCSNCAGSVLPKHREKNYRQGQNLQQLWFAELLRLNLPQAKKSKTTEPEENVSKHSGLRTTPKIFC